MFNDFEIHENLLSLRKKETALISEILQHLNIIEERKIYCDYGVSSLFVYCVKILNYTDGEAWRRVQAAKLLSLKPELKEKIDAGAISLTSASDVMNLFNRSEISSSDQKQLIADVLDKSSRETEGIIEKFKIEKGLSKEIKLSSRRKRVKADDLTKIEVYIGAEVKNDLDYLKGKLKIWDDKDLIEYLIKEKRKELDPQNIVVKQYNVKEQSAPRSISPSKKYRVYKNANSKCENCGSHFDLQIDHIIPVSRKGGNMEENLRLLCRQCNLRRNFNQGDYEDLHTG